MNENLGSSTHRGNGHLTLQWPTTLVTTCQLLAQLFGNRIIMSRAPSALRQRIKN
jgi:hypothetical protein